MIKLFALLIIISCSSSNLSLKAKTQTSKKSHKYKRGDWAHWIDSNGDCKNTRHEILISRSLVAVTLNSKGCSVRKGKWNDYYFPETHRSARFVDIDHLVPLKHAHLSGGAYWSKEKKRLFANDPENLVITNRKYNRQKGHKGIDKWLPVHRDYACKYIRDWLKIKKKYELIVTQPEKKTIESAKCDSY